MKRAKEIDEINALPEAERHQKWVDRFNKKFQEEDAELQSKSKGEKKWILGRFLDEGVTKGSALYKMKMYEAILRKRRAIRRREAEQRGE